MLAAQASVQLFKNNCGTSAIASEIVALQACATIIAPQVPTSVYMYIDQITFYHFFLHSTDIIYRDTVKHYHDFVNTTLHLNNPSLLLHCTLLSRCALNILGVHKVSLQLKQNYYNVK